MKDVMDDIRNMAKDKNIEVKTAKQVPPCQSFHVSKDRDSRPGGFPVIIDYLTNVSSPTDGQKTDRQDG